MKGPCGWLGSGEAFKACALTSLCCSQAEALNSAGSSSLYGVRLPEDMPPGMVYLEVEQGAFVGGPCAVLVMPSQRFMAAAEVLQLMRGIPTAATSLVLGGQLTLQE